MKITDVATLLGKKLIIEYMPTWPGWMCRFYGADVRVGRAGLLGVAGRGDTPDQSMSDYCTQTEGKLLIFNASSNDRSEHNMPTKLTVWE